MKIVYASRTGNVQSLVKQLNIKNTMMINSGQETVKEKYILFTYTDGYGDVPVEVLDFLSSNSEYLHGVIVSGDQVYGEEYCKAGDIISEEYGVPCLYKFENDGTDDDIKAINEILEHE